MAVRKKTAISPHNKGVFLSLPIPPLFSLHLFLSSLSRNALFLLKCILRLTYVYEFESPLNRKDNPPPPWSCQTCVVSDPGGTKPFLPHSNYLCTVLNFTLLLWLLPAGSSSLMYVQLVVSEKKKSIQTKLLRFPAQNFAFSHSSTRIQGNGKWTFRVYLTLPSNPSAAATILMPVPSLLSNVILLCTWETTRAIPPTYKGCLHSSISSQPSGSMVAVTFWGKKAKQCRRLLGLWN